MKERKMLLLVTKECLHKCPKCANNGKDLEGLPMVSEGDFRDFSEVTITGGEPMLYDDDVFDLTERIRKENKNCKIYLYTSMVGKDTFAECFNMDGVTIAIHDKETGEKLGFFLEMIQYMMDDVKEAPGSIRIMYDDIDFIDVNDALKGTLMGIDFKEIEWLDPCPVPEDKEFYRLPVFLENK